MNRICELTLRWPRIHRSGERTRGGHTPAPMPLLKMPDVAILRRRHGTCVMSEDDLLACILSSILAYPVACQMGKPMIIERNGSSWLSNDASRVSAGFPG